MVRFTTRFWGLALVGAWALGASTAEASSFETSDLAGTWVSGSLWDLPVAIDPGWDRLEVTLDASGAVQSGGFEDSEGTMLTANGGTVSITEGGVVSGTLTAPGASLSFGDYQMEPGLEAFVGAETDFEGYDNLAVVLRRGTGYQASDLEGSWSTYLMLQAIGAPAGESLTGNGVITVGSGGSMQFPSTLEFSNGFCVEFAADPATCIVAATYTMTTDANGVVSWIDTPVDEGPKQLSNSRTMLVGVHPTVNNQAKLEVMIKQTGSFQQQDLAGTWRTFQAYGAPAAGTFGWRKGTIQIASNGQVLGGMREDRSGAMNTITGGSFTLGAAGALNGTITYNNATDEQLLDFRMDAGKGIVAGSCAADTSWQGPGCPAGVDVGSLLDPTMIVWVPEPGVGWSGLVGALSLLVLRAACPSRAGPRGHRPLRIAR